MVAGRLQEKNGFYYIVLSYTDSAGKRRQPWIGTGLPVKGNKKRAEKMLADTRKDFTIPKGQVSELSPDMAFSDYMRYWLKMMRTAVTETTYSSYCFNVEKHIIPYFEPLWWKYRCDPATLESASSVRPLSAISWHRSGANHESKSCADHSLSAAAESPSSQNPAGSGFPLHPQIHTASGFAIQEPERPDDGKHADTARSAARKEVVI